MLPCVPFAQLHYIKQKQAINMHKKVENTPKNIYKNDTKHEVIPYE